MIKKKKSLISFIKSLVLTNNNKIESIDIKKFFIDYIFWLLKNSHKYNLRYSLNYKINVYNSFLVFTICLSRNVFNKHMKLFNHDRVNFRVKIVNYIFMFKKKKLKIKEKNDNIYIYIPRKFIRKYFYNLKLISKHYIYIKKNFIYYVRYVKYYILMFKVKNYKYIKNKNYICNRINSYVLFKIKQSNLNLVTYWYIKTIKFLLIVKKSMLFLLKKNLIKYKQINIIFIFLIKFLRLKKKYLYIYKKKLKKKEVKWMKILDIDI